jgi:hypothetical protein
MISLSFTSRGYFGLTYSHIFVAEKQAFSAIAPALPSELGQGEINWNDTSQCEVEQKQHPY